jgi:hypothetical protein
MKDFKIKGTELPTIPAGAEFRVVGWVDGNEFTFWEKPDLVSYGSEQYMGEEWILAEKANYSYDRYYMFKLKDIERLVEKQIELTELPQYWVVQCDIYDSGFKQVIDYLNEQYGTSWSGVNHGDYYGFDGNRDHNGTETWSSLSQFENNPTVLTIDEFIELTNKKENMNKVNKSDLGKIHNVACDTWKSKLETYAQRNLFCDSIELSDSEIDEMFAAATSSQVPVLVSILGERRVKIDYSRIKTGSKVMITHTGQHCSGITGIDLDEQVNVVFYKTQHFITGDNEFKIEGAHGNYTTFHQNGKFVLFSSDTSVDFITKVIEY